MILRFIYENCEWVLYDGDVDISNDAKGNKSISTNGIWRLISDKIGIYNNMDMKAGTSTFHFIIKH